MLGLLLALNIYRQQNGLPPVRQMGSLCTYANKRIGQLPNDWSHRGFYASHPYKYMVENLSKDYSDAEVMEAWKNSPTHRANLLSNINYACIISKTINGTHYVVMEGKK